MNKISSGIFFTIVLILTIVTIDIQFFRQNFVGRLLANISLSILFTWIYWKFFKKN